MIDGYHKLLMIIPLATDIADDFITTYLGA
jgi:hypothetical protein